MSEPGTYAIEQGMTTDLQRTAEIRRSDEPRAIEPAIHPAIANRIAASNDTAQDMDTVAVVAAVRRCR